ncbi:MAG: beta-lactamase family protein [Candidatus Marinimicrobia bacterium]|nr:beta-lactamase family protein [Candidatus Neomarinimicrobiota bacterium]
MTTGNMSRDVSYVSTPLTDEFDSVISEFLSETDVIPGMSIAVVKNDKVVYLKSFGYADIETKLEVNQDTKFYIASSTKSFTALTMLLLADKQVFNYIEIQFRPLR